MMPWWAPLAAALVLCAIAMVIELRTGEIPNWLTLGTLLVAPPVVALLDRRVVDHLAGFAIAALVTMVLYRNDFLGGGSVKLTCALGALIGMRQTGAMIATVAVGALALFAWTVIRQRLRGGPTPTRWVVSTPLLALGLAVSLLVTAFVWRR